MNSLASSRPTVAIHTHGCKLNQADSGQLARRFVQAGYRLVESAAEADVYVLNTCTVTATADAKARQALRAARRSNPEAVIVATGCYSQRASKELASLEAVTLVVPNTQKDDLIDLVSANAAIETKRDPLTELKTSFGGRVRAMVKIQEGCNQVCAYCIVPKVRGRERSIPPDELVAEVQHHVQEGFKEVVLTGTQLGTYGFDIPGTDLESLLRRMLNRTDLPRLRVSSLQAHEITPKLLELWQDSRLCPHFHVPLQSGSDKILKAMRRRYKTYQFTRTVKLVRSLIPHAAITTDVIVGFPGEGDLEFQESLQFAQDMEFSDIHIFPYSPRPGTSAAYLPETVDDQQKRDRVAEMARMARSHFKDFRRRQLGSVRPALWESFKKLNSQKVWSGLTDNYIRVAASHPADLRNTITQVRLEQVEDDTVIAEIL